MTWYLWRRGDYVPDYSIGKNESLVKLRAKTLQKAKEEVGLIITEENYDYSEPDSLVEFFRSDKEFYIIDAAKLFYVEQEIDLESDILVAQNKIREFRINKKNEQEKENRYQEYLKLKKEFGNGH